MASVGSIVGGAFRVLRERPVAVIAWGVTYVVGIIVIAMLVGLLGMGLGATPSPGFGGGPRFSGGFLLTMLLFYLGYFLLLSILMNAVFRTVLRPSQRRFFSLRLGSDEWRMLGLLILVLICSIVIMFVVQLMLTLLGTVISLIVGGSPMAAGLGAILLLIAYLCGVVWVSVKLSLLYPVSFYRRSISLDEAWSLTNGRFWTLFGSYLVVFAIVLVVLGTLFWVSFGDLLREVAIAGNNPILVQQAMIDSMARFYAVPLGVRILVALLWVVAIVIASVLAYGVVASAARELLIENGEVPEEDAEGTAAIFE